MRRKKKKSEMDVAGWARVDYICLYPELSAKTIHLRSTLCILVQKGVEVHSVDMTEVMPGPIWLCLVLTEHI